MTREEANDVIRIMKEGVIFSDEENDICWSYKFDKGKNKFSFVEIWTVIGSVTAEHDYDEAEFLDLLAAKFTYREITDYATTRSNSHGVIPIQSEEKTQVTPPKKEPETVAEAVDAHDWERLRALLAAGTKVPQHSAGADGPIHFAAIFGSSEAVRLLVEHGTPVNIPGSNGRTPLMYAAADARSPEMVGFLLQSGADVNAVSADGDNALFAAVSQSNPSTEVAAKLVDAGIDLRYVHPHYKTILNWAAYCGRQEIVALLLKHGADVNAQNDRNESPIAQAMMNGHHAIVKLLFAAGADAESINFSGWSLLEYATEAKDEILVREIIERTEANQSADKTSSEKRDAKIEALAQAAKMGNISIMQLLIERGVNVNSSSRSGSETPLMKAAYYGQVAAVGWLLDHHAAVEARDARGNTALLHAAWTGKRDVVELLLQRGADVNATNNLNWNALMQAALEGHYSVAELLLAQGAQTDLIDKEKGASAYYLAERSGSSETLEVLKKFNAKPREFRTLQHGEPYVDIRECEYCQYIPQRKDLTREESLGDYPGLVKLHTVSTDIDRYATSTIELFQCKLCGTFYQHDHYIDTEDDFIAGPTIYRHLQRMNLIRLQMALANYLLKVQSDEFAARLPELLQQMKEALARAGSEIHPHILPFFIESVVDAFLMADDWQGLLDSLLRHQDKKLALQVADDLVTIFGNGKFAVKGPEQDYKAYRHITPEVFAQTQKLLTQHGADFRKLLQDIAVLNEHATAASKVVESADYYKI